MNIFMVTSVPLIPPWDQGDKGLAYAITQALQKHRFRVMVTHDGPIPDGKNLDLVQVYRSRHPSLTQKARVYWQFKSPASPKSSIHPTFLDHKVDLYHLVYQPTPLSSIFGRFLPEFRLRPTVHTIPAVSRSLSLRRDLIFADRLVVLSGYARKTMQNLGMKNVTYIPPGIDVKPWADLHTQAKSLKNQLGLNNRPVILYPGHFTPGYGIEIILKALPEIVSIIPEVLIIFACRLRSAGDGKRELKVRRHLDCLGLEGNVLIHNTVQNMHTLIGVSDLTVLPLQTMRDKIDIPTTLLESLAAGVPIVISDIPPMNELVEKIAFPEKNNHKKTMDKSSVGFAVPPGDVDALVEAVITSLNDNELRCNLGQNGQELVSKFYDIRHISAQYEKLYLEMVQ